MPPRLRTFLSAALLAVSPALAGDSTSFTAFGLQAHLAQPTGSFGDNRNLDRKTGLGLGLHLPIELGDGHVLRPKVDFLSFNRDEAGTRYKAESLSILLDYNFYPEFRREGTYFIAGAGLHSTRRDVTRTFAVLPVGASDSGSGFAYNLGLGYAFNPNVALELKYMGLDLGELRFNGQGTDKGYMGNAVVASLSFTF